MQPELAFHIARTALRASRELGDLVPLMRAHLGESEFDDYAKAVGAVLASVHVELMGRLFADHPGLEAEIERSVATYDRLL